ncbi:MAG: TlpA family protein disulfide reductase [Acidobacteriota bacterium]|nr:TlpA family protein disulfide reductase [Acidobacteriota bacterium]
MRASTTAAIACSILAGATSCGPAAVAPTPAAPTDIVGSWRAVLGSPGGQLPFTLVIRNEKTGLRAAAVTGAEEAPFSAVSINGREVSLDFAWYDSTIRAQVDPDGERLSGEWTKTVPKGLSRMPFEAFKGDDRRFLPPEERDAETGSNASVAGDWAVEFTDDSSTWLARGEFEQDGSQVTGTFMTPTGDYRFLEGSFEAGVLRLSTFDGGHAFLFQATQASDGSLDGDFWSRETYHATWTAHRIDEQTAVLSDDWALVGLTNDDGRFGFRLPDLEGRELSLEDPRFDGKVVLVDIFGSWCPNCNDNAPYLADWYRRYRERGLEIVGLAFEFTGDVERDREQVRRYAKRHGIEFQLLLAGVSDKKKAAEILPDLSAVVAYPTTVFMGRDGRVRKIHTGYAGPGTGEHHENLVAELEALIEELLAEPV